MKTFKSAFEVNWPLVCHTIPHLFYGSMINFNGVIWTWQIRQKPKSWNPDGRCYLLYQFRSGLNFLFLGGQDAQGQSSMSEYNAQWVKNVFDGNFISCFHEILMKSRSLIPILQWIKFFGGQSGSNAKVQFQSTIRNE